MKTKPCPQCEHENPAFAISCSACEYGFYGDSSGKDTLNDVIPAYAPWVGLVPVVYFLSLSVPLGFLMLLACVLSFPDIHRALMERYFYIPFYVKLTVFLLCGLYIVLVPLFSIVQLHYQTRGTFDVQSEDQQDQQRKQERSRLKEGIINFVRGQTNDPGRDRSRNVWIEGVTPEPHNGSTTYRVKGFVQGPNFFMMTMKESFRCQVNRTSESWRISKLRFPRSDLLYMPFFP